MSERPSEEALALVREHTKSMPAADATREAWEAWEAWIERTMAEAEELELELGSEDYIAALQWDPYGAEMEKDAWGGVQ